MLFSVFVFVQGDSGSPLTCLIEDNWVVTGVTSEGPIICGVQGGVSDYVSVNYYKNWIDNIIRHCDDTTNIVCKRLLQRTYVRLILL